MFPIEKRNMTDTISKAQLDPAVGIKISLLWDDPSRCYYGTSIAPHQSLSAHYHNEGDELYFIISGNGLMHLGTLALPGVEWKQEFSVCTGDIFTVTPKTVHQLRNESDENLTVVFGCTKSHLNEDRTIIK